MASSLSLASTSSFQQWEEIYLTFLASVRSVGTACTLAGVGVYLHRRNFILGDGKRTLALISQQVTIPLLFFTKFINCNQDWSTDPCPDVTQSLKDVWMLLIWPLYVVGVGFSVGYVMARISKTPKHQIRAVLAACGFGNSTGLPITLLTVVHSNFPSTSDLGRVDPCLFLSVYLLLYPVLQWGVGGWLLAPSEKEKKASPTTKTHLRKSSGLAHNVLNQRKDSLYNFTHRGIGETDASMYMSVQENLSQYGGFQYTHVQPTPEQSETTTSSSSNIGLDLEETASSGTPMTETTSLLRKMSADISTNSIEECGERNELSYVDVPEENFENDDESSEEEEEQETLMETIHKVVVKCLQPPVVGALLGLFVASLPKLRGLFVDLVDRDGNAPLEWFFDGIYHVGQAAVPINMIILGCNLNASYQSNTKITSDGEEKKKVELFSPKTTAAVVLGKMVIMPTIGFLSVWLFRTYFWSIPEYIDGSFYLVVLIVFLTPTANNVMVMVELGGDGGSREAIARTIAWQYAASPIILSLTMTVAVGLADNWS